MKKTIALLMIISLSMGFIACGQDDQLPLNPDTSSNEEAIEDNEISDSVSIESEDPQTEKDLSDKINLYKDIIDSYLELSTTDVNERNREMWSDIIKSVDSNILFDMLRFGFNDFNNDGIDELLVLCNMEDSIMTVGGYSLINESITQFLYPGWRSQYYFIPGNQIVNIGSNGAAYTVVDICNFDGTSLVTDNCMYTTDYNPDTGEQEEEGQWTLLGNDFTKINEVVYGHSQELDEIIVVEGWDTAIDFIDAIVHEEIPFEIYTAEEIQHILNN